MVWKDKGDKGTRRQGDKGEIFGIRASKKPSLSNYHTAQKIIYARDLIIFLVNIFDIDLIV